jgi:hypothetical protein
MSITLLVSSARFETISCQPKLVASLFQNCFIGPQPTAPGGQFPPQRLFHPLTPRHSMQVLRRRPEHREVAMPKTKRNENKLYREFERGDWADDPDGPFFREYYFHRRHLAAGHRRLKCEIEGERLAVAMDGGLVLIKERDGADVLRGVSAHLLFELLTSIEYYRGGMPPSWRGALKELIGERQAADAKLDAQLKRRAVAA